MQRVYFPKSMPEVVRLLPAVLPSMDEVLQTRQPYRYTTSTSSVSISRPLRGLLYRLLWPSSTSLHTYFLSRGSDGIASSEVLTTFYHDFIFHLRSHTKNLSRPISYLVRPFSLLTMHSVGY